MIGRLTSFSIRHRWTVVGLWGALVVSTVVAAPALFDRLTADVGDIAGSESQRGYALLADADPQGETIYAAVAGASDIDVIRSEVEAASTELGNLPGVARIVTPWATSPGGTTDARMVSEDGDAVAIQVEFDPSPTGEDADRERRGDPA